MNDCLCPGLNECLKALGELDFDKRFLISRIVQEENVERTLRVQQIETFRSMPLEAVEAFLLKKPTVSLKRPSGSENASIVYRCIVHPDRRYSLEGPSFENSQTHLQRVFGNDKVLQVRFCNQESSGKLFQELMNKKILEEIVKGGILAGLRCYYYLVHKEHEDMRLRGYFICTKSYARDDELDEHFAIFSDIEACRAHLMNVQSVSSLPLYNKRLQLVLSKTIKVEIDLHEVNVREIDDVPCLDERGEIVRDSVGKPLIHSDGSGWISVDLARRCPKRVRKGQISDYDKDKEDYPLGMQIRLFHKGKAIKGTLLSNSLLSPNTICYRKSMLKVSEGGCQYFDSFDSLELCSTTHKPKEGRLSQYLVALLSRGGVPDDIFMGALEAALLNAISAISSPRAAMKLCLKSLEWDKAAMSFRMIAAGISLEYSLLQQSLKELVQQQLRELKKAKIPIERCYNLMGLADPTDTLLPNQVGILLADGPIFASRVLVYKHPGVHAGDIRGFEATWNATLESAVGAGKYGIIFPVKGSRSVVDEIANSDLDGDIYWVCTNQNIVEKFKQSEAWVKPEFWQNDVEVNRKPCDLSTDELQEYLIQRFLKKIFRKSNPAAVASTNWMAHMDKFLSLEDSLFEEKERLDQIMMRLTNLYYEALDSEKTGKEVFIPMQFRAEKVPHFMEYASKQNYRSTSILGRIYDRVADLTAIDHNRPLSGGYDLSTEVRYEGYEAYTQLWQEHFDEYRSMMTNALKCKDQSNKDQADEITAKYRRILYGGECFRVRKKKKKQIYREACAIYHVVTQHSMRYDKSPFFAWSVAGDALCDLFLGLSDNPNFTIAAPLIDSLCNI